MGVIMREDPIERLMAARDEAEDDLLSDEATAFSLLATSGSTGLGYENIVGVGISERFASGRPTAKSCVTVYVVRKSPPEEVEPGALVPPDYQGVPTDVVETGEFVAFSERGRLRPAPCGVSVGNVRKDAGTLGFLAYDGSELVIVSNNHVLALGNEAEIGDAIVQPGQYDGGTSTDAIGSLKRFEPLDFGGRNSIDAAIATAEHDLIVPEIFGLGPYAANPVHAQQDMLVRKVGRSTGMTRGIIRDANATIRVRYPQGVARFRHQFLVEGRDAQPFSDSGDSGSLVFEEASRAPVGLLCGGTPRFTVVNRIEQVLDGLGLSLAT